MGFRRRYLQHSAKGPAPGQPYLTPEVLASEFKGGDFARDPWFEATDLDRYFSNRGFPKECRQAALAGLRRLYTPEVCLDLLQRPLHGGLVLPFFSGAIAWHIFPRLELGLDLQASQPWDDADLLARLRNAHRFAEARAELEVWANLREGGIEHVREPITAAGKRPDFRLDANSSQYFLEVKLLDESDAEAFADEFHEELLEDVPHELFRPAQVVTIRASASYAGMAQSEEGLNRLDAERETIRSAFRSAYAELISKGVPIGVFQVEPFGSVTVETADPGRGNEAGVEFVPPARPEKRAVRAARLYSRACAQLPPEGTGVVLVRARHGVPLQTVLQRVREWAEVNPSAAQNCDVFVARAPVRLPSEETASVVAIATLGPRSLTSSEVEMLRLVARPRHASVPDPSGPDEPRKLK